MIRGKDARSLVEGPVSRDKQRSESRTTGDLIPSVGVGGMQEVVCLILARGSGHIASMDQSVSLTPAAQKYSTGSNKSSQSASQRGLNVFL